MTPPPTIRDDLSLMAGYHSPQVDASVRLNTNESPYPPPAAWSAMLADEVGRISFNRYPDRQAMALRRAIGELHGVGPDQVLATNGSNEALQALCLAYGGSGRCAAVFEPTYALHAHIARITGTVVNAGERGEDFRLDPAEVRRLLAATDPAITFVCSPNNPTGGAETAEMVTDIISRAPGLVVVDEAYAQFSTWSAMAMVNDASPVVVTRTYSKTWSLAGARLGYVVAPAAVIAGLERVILPYHLDSFTQAAGLAALRFTHEMEGRVKLIVAERERITAALDTLNVKVWPSNANFILFRPGRSSSDSPEPLDSPAPSSDRQGPPSDHRLAMRGRAVWQGLLDRSVLVRDCSSWPRLNGALRVTVGTPPENDAFLVALGEVLAA